MKKKDNRRSFIKGVLLALGGTATTMANAEGKTTKMLTPDGKLVEVNQSVIEKSTKTKASNKSILDWTNQIKS